MKFLINIENTKEMLNTMDEIALVMQSCKEGIDNINLGNDDTFVDLRQMLQKESNNVELEISNLFVLQGALQQSIELYLQTENKLINGNEQKQESDTITNIVGGISSNLKQDFIFSAIQSSGGLVSRFGGLINVGTAIAKNGGENGFVIVNPNVLNTTSKMIKAGNWMSTGAKYGLPVLGGILDFTSQVKQGEDTTHAVVKSTVHTVNGVLIGMAIGSVIPGAGTVVGAVAGLVIGTVVTYAVNAGFDYVYDNYIKEAVTDVVSNVANGIGDAVDGIFNSLGTVFG
ncbi:hypothetical protein QTL86_15555 [Cellulosilyticum sp. ST5]|uniref:hypothetical protein n=1 Tax=unclassified Cellulosilyticum TaxID=2643091 RepID=UPI001A9BED1C|nr:hypothetical protein [Cellulosilyticum sp. WCF-2]